MEADPTPGWRAHAVRWGPVAAFAVILVLHSLRYDFVTDDAYISFVFSRNLAEHGELTFNLGEPVEGYTNFLWTVMLALGIVLGIPPEIASRVLGVGFGIGTLIVVFRLCERVLGRRSPFAYLAPALLALSSGFACWSSGGLETQLFTFLVTLALDLYIAADARPRLLTRCGAVLALAAMTRPEGLLIVAVLGAHRVLMHGVRWRWTIEELTSELLWAMWFLIVWAPWFVWRWRYYGWMFPNTYYVKATGATTEKYDAELLKAGFTYVRIWIEQTGLLHAAPLWLAGLVAWKRAEARFALVTAIALLAGAYLVYTISVGGDFMGLHRFIMPLFPMAAMLVALGLDRLAGFVPVAARRWAAAGAIGVVCLAFGISQSRLDERSLHPKTQKERSDQGIDSPAYLIAYTENRAAIGKAMNGCFTDEDFSIVGGAGAQPYFARMRGIDVFGLVSSRIAHEVKPTKPRPGHNKWGPDPLLFEHDPDFVFHCYAIHSSPAIGPLGCGGFWRGEGFEQVTLRIPGLDGKREGRDDRPGGAVADHYTFFVRKDRNFTCDTER
jgi:hypothetical protein